ncbi:MAG: cyclic nucleotide-binding domain-containing protein [Gammaproteobacteria bacterium]|nr:cyclic nucleotide-binding domain-containing protein [Gammaproteobacteria bacterium]
MKAPKSQDKKFSGQEILRDLIPLNSLTESRYNEIISSLTIEDITAGSYLFSEGDRDNRSIYLLDGVVNFIDSDGKVSGTISAGTDPARSPLANQQPRLVTARAITKSVIACIASTLLDVMLTLDQSAEGKSKPQGSRASENWITRMLQSEALIKLPPPDIQRLLLKLESVNVKAGDVIIRQGDEGDYFYIIREGKCAVTRLASGEGWDVPLAELTTGDCFGEEALVSEVKRNATISMVTDGTLMRLSKKNFVELLKKNLVHYINYELATAAVKEGGIWLDVRLADEYSRYSIDNSINVPLFMVRDRAHGLDPEKKYIICCDTGRRSAAAAFLLSQRGLEVCVLEGGMNNSIPADLPGMTTDTPSAAIVKADKGTTATRRTRKPAENNNRTAGYMAKLKTLQKERDAAREESREIRGQLAELQQEMSALQTSMVGYMSKSMQLEAAFQDDKQARDALSDLINKLAD